MRRSRRRDLPAGCALRQRYRTSPARCPSWQVFATQDGYIMLSVGHDPTFRRFCENFGLDALPDDPRFAANAARATNRDAATAALAPVLGGRPTAWATGDQPARGRVCLSSDPGARRGSLHAECLWLRGRCSHKPGAAVGHARRLLPRSVAARRAYGCHIRGSAGADAGRHCCIARSGHRKRADGPGSRLGGQSRLIASIEG
jgi:hypothetical protein